MLRCADFPKRVLVEMAQAGRLSPFHLCFFPFRSSILSFSLLSVLSALGLFVCSLFARCGPCRSFTPALRQLYSDKLKAQGVEVVFVSSDQDDASFANYYGEMPWLAVPFDARDVKENLSSQFDISGIPALIVLDARNGKVISADGRRDVMVHKQACGTHWLSLIK